MTRAVLRAGTLVLASVVLVPACRDGDDDGDGSSETSGAEPFFPEDYESSYTEVRDCRGSGDHDLNNIRVFADAAAMAPYENHTDPFPEGAVLVKAEYDFGDIACEGEPIQWTAMRRLVAGNSPDTLDWSWQQVDFDRTVVEEDSAACIGCHTSCGEDPPPGYLYESTCTQP